MFSGFDFDFGLKIIVVRDEELVGLFLDRNSRFAFGTFIGVAILFSVLMEVVKILGI